MAFLQALTKDAGHFKGGFYGDTGSGKSTTAVLIALGLYRHWKMKGPIAFFDSERGSPFLLDLFKLAKIEVVGVHSRSFDDLSKFMTETIKAKVGISIVDSVTHPWREIMEAYLRSIPRQSLRPDDWGKIKRKWHAGFTIPFINSKMSIIMCARQANIFEDKAEDGTWKPVKVGTRMGTEAETGYEPNILVELQKQFLEEGGRYARVATVLKDRAFKLDGREAQFVMPRDEKGEASIEKLLEENQPFKFILPHVLSLDPNSDKTTVKAESTEEIFDEDGNTEWQRAQKEKELLLGNIESLLSKYYPSRDKISMKSKNDIIEGVSWSLGRRTRNWDVVSQKFKPDMVRMMYHLMDKTFQPAKRRDLEDALLLGVSDKGEITNADAAPEAIMKLCEAMIKESGSGPEDDLPF